MKIHPLILYCAIAVFFLLLLVPFTEDTEVYNLEDVKVSGTFHNPIAMKKISREETANMQGLMSEFFGSQSTIVLNVKLKNFDDAKRDLEEYSRNIKQFDNLVIKLDMTSSEIAEFKQKNHDQLKNLENLVNDSIGYDRINKLALQYEDDDGSLYTLGYEGAALKERMQAQLDEYVENVNVMEKHGTASEVDTRSLRDGIATCTELQETIQSEQKSFENLTAQRDTGRNTGESLTLKILPDNATYGYTFQATGTLTGPIFPEKEKITLIIDSKTFQEIYSSTEGNYIFTIPTQEYAAGTHIAYTRTEEQYSPIVRFTVIQTMGNLTLFCTRAGENISCSGTLTVAGTMPVPNASVQMYMDGKPAGEVITDARGYYTLNVPADKGEHTFVSAFSDPNIALYACTSPEVTLSEKNNPGILIVLIIVIVIGGYYSRPYIRRILNNRAHTMRRETGGEQPVSAEPSPETEAVRTFNARKRDDYLRIVEEDYRTAIENGDETGAVHLLGEALALQINALYADLLSPGLTIRERCNLPEVKREKSSLPEFIQLYEETMYGRRSLKGNRSEEILSIWSTEMKQIQKGGKL